MPGAEQTSQQQNSIGDSLQSFDNNVPPFRPLSTHLVIGQHLSHIEEESKVEAIIA